MAIERKTGDALLISGTLEGDNLPPDTAWVGATAKINIATAGGTVVIDHAMVSLDVTAKTFSYVGNPINVPGKYYVEIEVTFPSISQGPVTFPNNTNLVLTVHKAVI